ncbi:hypothetical protein cand_012260 [Cryptosporidium andersoni]|uniref:Uncharacterized protein n=1 Tax=Cryptosporidium andersoni TaxID=117008 RepID=A0A1J4MEX1_9CRYT|nr:hypothetical protein cand_012260 [Cryptosporidium andersoni]
MKFSNSSYSILSQQVDSLESNLRSGGNFNYGEGIKFTYNITPPRKGISICFGFGNILAISKEKISLFCLYDTLLKNSIESLAVDSIQKLQDTSWYESKTSDLSIHYKYLEELLSKINEELLSETLPVEEFRHNCYVKLLMMYIDKKHLPNSPSEYQVLFNKLTKSNTGNIWICVCHANGKSMDLISERSKLGFKCATAGVVNTIRSISENYPNSYLLWIDKFALSGLCGEKELSQCYFDFVNNKEQFLNVLHPQTLNCSCFSDILDMLYLCSAQRLDHFKISLYMLELWPFYVYTLVSTLGTSHIGSRKWLSMLAQSFQDEIVACKSKLSLHEKIFGFQFCQILLTQLKELPIGINVRNILQYVHLMDISKAIMTSTNKIKTFQYNVNSLFHRYLYIHLIASDIGCYKVALKYLDIITEESLNLNIEDSSSLNNLRRYIQDLKNRIIKGRFEYNRKVPDINFDRNHIYTKQTNSNSRFPNSNKTIHNSSKSSWLVGWVSSSFKKAFGTEEERWSGVENTFYYDKELKQWCQRGVQVSELNQQSVDTITNNQKLPNIPPPASVSTSRSAHTSNISSITGVRSRYVDVLHSQQNK